MLERKKDSLKHRTVVGERVGTGVVEQHRLMVDREGLLWKVVFRKLEEGIVFYRYLMERGGDSAPVIG